MLTASVPCQDSTKAGPGLLSSFWRASASQTAADSEPGEAIMYSILTLRTAPRIAAPPSRYSSILSSLPPLRGAYQHRILAVRKRRRAARGRDQGCIARFAQRTRIDIWPLSPHQRHAFARRDRPQALHARTLP